MNCPVISFSRISFFDDKSSRNNSLSAEGVRPRVLVPARASEVTILSCPDRFTLNSLSGVHPRNSRVRTPPLARG